MKINEIPPLEHDFTEVLKTLALIPKMLYFYGKLPENMPIIGRKKCVAIVGSRKNTSYGREVAYQAAYEAAKAGAIVISGLAYGIDSIAHRGALDAGGITIAVLGTPIDDIYPKAHIGLAREITEKGGAIISEYGPGEISHSKGEVQARFLARNRIIAGLSDLTLITEAADRSGSLNTASHALDIGSDLMAVPGDITRLTSRGCNRLLMQGAIPYTEPNDLLDLLFPERLI
ncbi:DNA-processing protein DprA, partial [Candidatus Saccharibacteria bacterium]|nr:DNA-processing protein DprA [Candidatus Saccharibacteria bacterium]